MVSRLLVLLVFNFTGFSGPLTGNVTGAVTGNVTGNCSGTAGSTGVLSAGATGVMNLTLKWSTLP